MMRSSESADGLRKILVVIPNWVGDVVMASPVLAALRRHFQAAHITHLMRSYVREITSGGHWSDSELNWPAGRGLQREAGLFKLAGKLHREKFDLALLLTNSFRSGLVTWLARIPRRVGFARDGRTLMLSDRLRPLRKAGEFVPAPVLNAYVELAEHVGCRVEDRRLRLGVTLDQEAAGEELKKTYGLTGRRYAVINPGAAFGAAKCWLPQRFAELCDRISTSFDLTCIIVGAPGETELMRSIAGQAAKKPVCCDRPGTTLGSLKPLIRDAALLVCNDTGPRHYGNAFGVPTVTIFGPTHQAWTDTDYSGETKLQVAVECGPCQLRQCPLDHRCMTRMTVEQVLDAVRVRLSGRNY